MARKAKAEAPENHERWLVSYADFITLLFAFFVVMFAKADSEKAKKVSESLTKALNEGNAVAVVTSAIAGATQGEGGNGNAQTKIADAANKSGANAALAELAPTMTYLNGELAPEIKAGKILMEMRARGLVVSLMEAAFFASGQDAVEPAAMASLAKIAQAIRKIPNPVRLEGHTDSVPIHNSRFRSNWELSSARAVAILNLFTAQYGIPDERLCVAGYAENAPVGPNDTPDGRARNRRVDVVILNKVGAAAEPDKDTEPKSKATESTPSASAK